MANDPLNSILYIQTKGTKMVHQHQTKCGVLAGLFLLNASPDQSISIAFYDMEKILQNGNHTPKTTLHATWQIPINRLNIPYTWDWITYTSHWRFDTLMTGDYVCVWVHGAYYFVVGRER